MNKRSGHLSTVDFCAISLQGRNSVFLPRIHFRLRFLLPAPGIVYLKNRDLFVLRIWKQLDCVFVTKEKDKMRQFKTLVIFLLPMALVLPACDTFTKVRTSIELQPSTSVRSECLQKGLTNHEIKKSYSQSYVHSTQFKYHQEYGLKEATVFDVAFPKYPRHQSFEIALETCENNKKFISAQYSALNGLSQSKAEILIQQTLENILRSCEENNLVERIENSPGFCNRQKAVEKKE